MLRFNITRLICILFCLMYLAPGNIHAQTVKEFATIDSLKVGDTFNFTITLNRSDQYQKITFPDSSDMGDPFEIRERQHFQISSYKDSVAYKLQFFGTTDTTLPALPILLISDQDTTTLYTNPIVVPFHSVLSAQEQELRPLKPIYDFAADWWPYILGVLILVLASYVAYRYFSQKEPQKETTETPSFTPAPFVNPLKELQKAIRELEQMKLESRDDFKEFYIHLGDAIRTYYEELHGLPALETTSRELLAMLKERAIDQDLVSDTRAVLQEADMVKFANFTPSEKEANRALEKAHNFLKRARQVDGPRIDHLRRRHHAEMESKKERFREQQENKEVNP